MPALLCRISDSVRQLSGVQQYLCKDCGRTFNDKTGTVFEYSAIPLRKWYLAVYTYIRLNTSIRQLDAELAVSYKIVYRRVQRFLRALDAPRPQLEGPVEIDDLYVNARKKGRKRDRGTYHEDKPPVFILADRGTGEIYVHPQKAADESTIRLPLADSKEESLTVYTNGIRAYEPLDEDDAFDCQHVVNGEGESLMQTHTSTHARATRRWRDGGSRPIEVSLKTSSHPISERYSFENVSGETR